MIRRLPLWPTLFVAAAVATMVALGFWQLQRADAKAAMLATYAAASNKDDAVAWPREPTAVADALYRRSSVTCERVLERRATAGRNAQGQSGWAQIARCALDGGGKAEIVLGWSADPRTVAWSGGSAQGIVAPSGEGGARLVAEPPLARLQAHARPDPGALPNNHLAYAGQWFFFAAAAAVIYALAVRKRTGAR